ncbi:MAG: hypothetical protein Q9218_006999 [Villophora microphyllina]
MGVKVVQRIHAKHQVTHSLRIPLATAVSTPQLLESIAKVAEDPIAMELPRAVWSVPDQLQLPIAGLSLKTSAQENAATQLLQQLDLGSIMRDIEISLNEDLVSSKGKKGRREQADNREENERDKSVISASLFGTDGNSTTDIVGQVTPSPAEPTGALDLPTNSREVAQLSRSPMITLRELNGHPNLRLRRNVRLYCNVIERRPFLRELRRRIFEIFGLAGFIPAVLREELPLHGVVMSTTSLPPPSHKPSPWMEAHGTLA